jgi:hypothetical protein
MKRDPIVDTFTLRFFSYLKLPAQNMCAFEANNLGTFFSGKLAGHVAPNLFRFCCQMSRLTLQDL